MEIRKLLNGKYEFINESKGNRQGFYHRVVLHKNICETHIELADKKVQYYNRTWECYQFQTAMQSCIRDLIKDKETRFLNLCKEKYNIKRLTQAKREQALKTFEELEEIKELRQCYAELEYRG